MRISHYLAASIVLAMLGGCSGTSLTGGADTSSLAGASGFTDNSAATKRFDPFNEFPQETTPRRVVIKNPTLAQVMKVGVLPDISMGRADAPITMIKYASLTCPFCRQFQKVTFPTLKREYIDTGKVRFIIREFPIGRQSGLATVAWRCNGPKTFFKLYDKFLFNQKAWVSQEVRAEPILKIASQMGMTRAKFDSCAKNQAMVQGLKWIKDRGRTLGVIGTPTLFVNEKMVGRAMTIEQLRAVLDPLLAGKVVRAGAAGSNVTR